MATTEATTNPTTTHRRSPGVVAVAALLLAALGVLVVAAATGHTGADPTPVASVAPPTPVSCESHVDPDSVSQAKAPTTASLATALVSIAACYEPGSMEPGPILGPVVVADPPAMAALVAAIDNGDKWPDGPISCPADFGEQFDLVLIHGDGTRQTVVVTTSGCRTVFVADQFHQATQPLIDQLNALFPDPNRP